MAEIIPREFIDLLLAKIDLVDLINQQIPLRKKTGSNYFARCPFHQEKSASFSVSQTKQFYYCFGCGAHGNAIDFLIQHDRLNFPEAIETLARQVGMEIPHQIQTDKKIESTAILYKLLEQVANFYYQQMRQSKRAIDYLKQRGISGVIAQQFNIGYASPGWSHLIEQFGKTDNDKKKLLETGLIIQKEDGSSYDRFRDRIIFPIEDYRGRLIGFGGRILDQGEPKYLNSPETILFQKGHELYGLSHAVKQNRQLTRVLIVEGYMDVIALFQHGINYAVATLGTATTPHHLQRLTRYTSDIIFCFDGDAAGRTAAWRALQTLLPILQDDIQIRFLFLPDGEDPDTLIRKESKAQFEQRIDTALTLSQFFFHHLTQQIDLQSMEGRARLANSALGYLKLMTAPMLQKIMLDELSKRTRITTQDLQQQIHQPKKSTNETIIESEHSTQLSAPMRLALILLVQQPQLANLIQDDLPPSQMTGYKFLLHLVGLIKEKVITSTGALLEYWREKKEGNFLAKLAASEHMIPEQGLANEFLGTIRQLLNLIYDEKIDQLLAKLAQTELSSAEKQELTNYIAKKKALAVQV